MTDIRKFFVPHKRMKTSNESDGVEKDTGYDDVTQEKGESNAAVVVKNSSNCTDGENRDGASTSVGFKCVAEKDSGSSLSILDVGNYIEKKDIDDCLKYKILLNPWQPQKNYDFKNDGVGTKRTFRPDWLSLYPWLVYSKAVKGPLCKFCVLFRPRITHGSHHGAFINRPFTNFKKFHECAKMHMNSEWHKDAIEKSNNFISVVTNKTKSVEELVNENLAKLVQTNRAKLKSIVSCVLFCALHDLPLRGKTNSNAIFDDLLQFRVHSGDETLQKHFETAPKNATYVSHRTQNDLIDACADVLRYDLIHTINNSESFSVLADETMDVAGTEQLSLAARYFDPATNVVREDFLGFTPLTRLDAKHISDTIISTLSAWGLNLDKMVGQGYDGCSTMAGKIGGVQKMIAEKYPKARFYHCASHRLNLVVNDLNTLPEVRNAIGTIKEAISFFRGSMQRKVLVGNLQKLCETRWSEKHKSIRKFNEKFLEIVEALTILHKEGDRETRQKAWQFYCTLTSATFIVTLKVIAKYSAKLEPVTNILQSVNINLLEVSEHIQEILKMLMDDRENAETEFETIMKSAESNYSALGIDVTGIRQPRVVARQMHRSNHPSVSLTEYYRKSLFIPYLDSLVQSLQERFSEENKTSFEIFCLHPKIIKSQSDLDLKIIIENIKRFYGDLIDNFTEEARTWISMWKRDTVTERDVTELSLIDLLDKAKFLPAVASALKIALSLPATTCSVERSFRYSIAIVTLF